MVPPTFLLALSLLLLPYLTTVAPARELLLPNHQRDVTTRGSLGRRLETSVQPGPLDVKGLANNNRDHRDQIPGKSWDRREKAISKRQVSAKRHGHPKVHTIPLPKEEKYQKLSYATKTENQKPMNYKSEHKNLQLFNNKFPAPKKWRSDLNTVSNLPIIASPLSKLGREKTAERRHMVPQNEKDKRHILRASRFENLTQEDFTFYDAGADKKDSSHNDITKPIAFSVSKNKNLKDPNKAYRKLSSIFPRHKVSRVSGAKQTELPKLTEERLTRSTPNEKKARKTESKTVYMEDNEASDVREHSNHGTFHCGYCKCSYTQLGKIIAKCTDKFIARFPDDLPTNIWQLILVGSRIKLLNMTRLTTYPSLSQLKLFNNKHLRHIEKSVKETTSLITNLDLSENTIDSLEDNSFELMPRLLTLNLAHNSIKAITNLTFSGLDNLRSLNLSKNNLRHIDSAAFDSLIELQTLDLSKNTFSYYKQGMTPRLMEPLKKLQYLLLHGCSYSSSLYPNKPLQQLTHLQRLSINGLHGAIFGPEISTLKHLTRLDLGFHHGKCHISEITDVFFQNLPYLHTLTLEGCNQLKKIESTTPGKPLCKTLRHLKIVYSFGYDLTTALSDLKAFQNSSLQTLAFNALYRGESRLPCRFLRGEDALHLENLKLEELDLSYNRLSLLDNEFLIKLPKTLKRLILAHNRFTLDGFAVDRLLTLNELVEIDTSYQNMETQFFRQENVYPYQKGSEHTSIMGNASHAKQAAFSSTQKTIWQTTHQVKDPALCKLSESNHGQQKPSEHCPCSPCKIPERSNTISNMDSKVRLKDTSEDKTLVLQFPPKLQIIQASYHNSFGMRVLLWDIKMENALIKVNFSNSFLSKLSLGSLSPSIEIADLSNNYCDSIGTSFFQPNNSLAYLSLQNNVLGVEFANDTYGSIFALLNKARYLNLQNNMIYKLPQKFFSGLRHLETLVLSKNRLEVLDIKLSHMTSLRMLNLSENSISWISRDTRNDLDILAMSHSFQVDLTLNPLPCTCDGLEFINWIAKTKVHFMYKGELTCRIVDGKTVEFGDILQRSRSLQHHCASKPLIVVICVASICIMAILVGFSVLYRYRWKLRYLQHIVLKRMVGFKPQQNQGQGYKFDAYILYTEELQRFVHVDCLQELETKRGHRLCISERDFLPGTYNLSNIVSAIQNSAKTVVVVTPDLYEDEYSEYGIKMAIMEELYKNRNILHLCVYQPMPPDDMAKCHDLLMVMKRNHYTEYPPDDQATEEIRQNFWDQLSLAIGHEHDPQVPAELELQ